MVVYKHNKTRNKFAVIYKNSHGYDVMYIFKFGRIFPLQKDYRLDVSDYHICANEKVIAKFLRMLDDLAKNSYCRFTTNLSKEVYIKTVEHYDV